MGVISVSQLENSGEWATFLKTWAQGDETTTVVDPDGIAHDSPQKQIQALVDEVAAVAATGKAGMALQSFGPTANRPSLGADEVYIFGDTDLGHPIYWNGTAWVHMDGTAL